MNETEKIKKMLKGNFLNKYKIVKPFFEKQKPYTIEIHPTYRCSYNCEFCIDDYLKKVPSINGMDINCDGKSQLTKENMDTIINGCLELGIKGIILSGGGDPPLNPNTEYLVKESKKKNIGIGMFTNGYILNDQTIPSYVDNLTFLRFSFDSFEVENYIKTKGTTAKAYWRVLANIEKCTTYKKENKSSCKIGMDFLIQPHNVHLIKDLYRKASELMVDYVQFCDCVVPGYHFTDNLKERILEEVGQCLTIKANTENPYNGEEGKKMSEVVYEPAPVENTTNCSDCKMKDYIFQVGGSGLVHVCPHTARHDHTKYGDINEQSLKEIWDTRSKKIPSFLYEYCRFREQNKILSGLEQIEHGDIL